MRIILAAWPSLFTSRPPPSRPRARAHRDRAARRAAAPRHGRLRPVARARRHDAHRGRPGNQEYRVKGKLYMMREAEERPGLHPHGPQGRRHFHEAGQHARQQGAAVGGEGICVTLSQPSPKGEGGTWGRFAKQRQDKTGCRYSRRFRRRGAGAARAYSLVSSRRSRGSPGASRTYFLPRTTGEYVLTLFGTSRAPTCLSTWG